MTKTEKNLNGILKYLALVALAVLFIFVMNGCVSSYNGSTRSPYGHSSQRRICVAGNCGTVIDQEQIATVDTSGYDECVVRFKVDNEAGLAICEAGVTGCRYSQVEIMDACTLRAGALNGSQFGMMPFGQFMPLYTSGYFNGMTANYSMQRQAVLYGPQVPNLPPASQTRAGMSEEELEAELVTRGEQSAAARAAQ